VQPGARVYVPGGRGRRGRGRGGARGDADCREEEEKQRMLNEVSPWCAHGVPMVGPKGPVHPLSVCTDARFLCGLFYESRGTLHAERIS